MQDRLREQFVRDQVALLKRAELWDACRPGADEGFWKKALGTFGRLSRWLDDSLLGAALGALTIFWFVVATAVFLPLLFEVMQ